MMATLLVLFTLASKQAGAQYYYKDILNTKKLNDEYSLLKANKISLVKISSFEDNDEPSEGFFCEKKIKKDFSESEMISRSYITGESVVNTRYDKDGRVTRSENNTPTLTNITEYEYDSAGHVSAIKTVTAAEGDNFKITETHTYSYSDEGILLHMLRKKNDVVIDKIFFITGDNGNIIEENAGNNEQEKKYFYYYDDQNRLTDVVHYNEFAKKLLPDYMFAYDTSARPKQMTTVDASGSNYFIWRYAYTDTGLPEIEKCYSKEKRVLGTIQYEYR